MIALGSETDEVIRRVLSYATSTLIWEGVHIEQNIRNKAKQDRRGGSRTLEDFIDVKPPKKYDLHAQTVVN